MHWLVGMLATRSNHGCFLQNANYSHLWSISFLVYFLKTFCVSASSLALGPAFFFFLPCRSLCKSVIISLRVVRLKWLLGEYFQLIREFQFFLRSIFHWSVFTKHKVVMQKVHFTAKVWRFYCLSVTHKP